MKKVVLRTNGRQLQNLLPDFCDYTFGSGKLRLLDAIALHGDVRVFRQDFSIDFSVRAQHIVEFGILLDVLAGVMIMAIILQNIKQTLDDVDTALLRTLKE